MRPDYVVLSERMLQEITDRAAKTGFRVQNVQVRPPFTGLTIADREAANLHVLAERVTAALHDETGTTELPGSYIGARHRFRGWMFSFDAERTPVVWLAAVSPEMLLVLCGSARNVLGYAAPKRATGWRPSSAGGLREVVASLRKKDPKSLLGYEASEPMQREMASDAAWITAGLTDPPEIEGDFDVLLKPYVYVEGFDERYITGLHLRYDRVVVGAPLWVREITDLPIPGHK